MKGHSKVCNRELNGSWTYRCTCNKVKKTGLKFEASATAIHDAHVRLMNRYAKSH